MTYLQVSGTWAWTIHPETVSTTQPTLALTTSLVLLSLRNFGPNAGTILGGAFPLFYYYLLFTWLAGITASYYTRFILGRKGAIVLGIIFSFCVGYVYYAERTLGTWNSVFQRNKDIVEVPINFERMTQRLVNEGVKFLEQRYEDKQPFFLMMSWIQVHTFLHASEPFKGM